MDKFIFVVSVLGLIWILVGVFVVIPICIEKGMDMTLPYIEIAIVIILVTIGFYYSIFYIQTKMEVKEDANRLESV